MNIVKSLLTEVGVVITKNLLTYINNLESDKGLSQKERDDIRKKRIELQKKIEEMKDG